MLKPLMTRLAVLLAGMLSMGLGFAQQDPRARDPVFARVAGVEITAQEFASALRAQARRRFYHGSPPEAEIRAFQREVADDLIERVLVQQEGLRRGVCAGSVERALADAKVAADCRQALRQEVLADLPAVDESAVRGFYRDNLDLFREPERLRASVILVKVPPSAGAAQWQETLEMVQSLRDQVTAGEASFADLAREFSDDASAARGGDMGYMHAGMLGQSSQEALAELEPGQVSDPVVLLEGVALLRLDERQEARQRDYTDVRERATALYRERRAGQRWASFLAGLREQADIAMDESFLQLGGPSKPAPGKP